LKKKKKKIDLLKRREGDYYSDLRKIESQRKTKTSEYEYLEKLIRKYKLEISRDEYTERQIEKKIKDFELKRKFTEEKLVYLQKSYTLIEIEIIRIRKRIKLLKSEIISLERIVRQKVQQHSTNKIHIQKLIILIKESNSRLNKYRRFEEKFTQRLRQYIEQIKTYERQISVISRSEDKLRGFLGELKSLNRDMFNIKLYTSKNALKRVHCRGKLKKYTYLNSRYNLQIRLYKSKIEKLIKSIKSLYSQESSYEEKNRYLSKSIIEIKKRIAQLRVKLYKERTLKSNNRLKLKNILILKRSYTEELIRIRQTESRLRIELKKLYSEINGYKILITGYISKEKNVQYSINQLDSEKTKKKTVIYQVEKQISEEKKLKDFYEKEFEKYL